MYHAGQRVLFWNISDQPDQWAEHTFVQGSTIEVVFAVDVDQRMEAVQGGPWGVSGWTLDALTHVAQHILDPQTGQVVWRRAEPSVWQDYSSRAAPDHSVVGTLKVLPEFWSPQLGNERDVLLYLPPSYATGTRRYPVVYMHDGQNLFDQATAFGDEWRVDETMEALSRSGLEAIVVGVPNAGVARCNEYSPFNDARHGGGCGDEYLDFLVQTLKPRIDQDFRTLPDRAHTGLLGSSMGGLISLYGFFKQAQTFGFAGVMSPALWFGQRAIFRAVEQATALPGKIYLDVGAEEGTSTVNDARRMYALLRRKGCRAERDLLYVEEAGAHHCEAAWAGRLAAALQFLLPNTQPQPRPRRSRREQTMQPGAAASI